MADAARLNEIVARRTAALLSRAGGPERIHSAVVAVDWPSRGIATVAAAGRARADGEAPMTPDVQFHIASVAKPMTAVLVLQAAEEGRLGADGIDARLIDTGALPPDVCRRLHVLDGRSHGDAITLRHLLTHTSGLRDGQIDDALGTAEDHGGPAPGSIVGRKQADLPAHLAALADGRAPDAGLATRRSWIPWDPARPDEPGAGLVNFYLAGPIGGHALFPPSVRFHYSDTAFTILALVAETLLGRSYHRLLRERIFDPLEMDRAFLDSASDLDPAPWRGLVSDCWGGDVAMLSHGVDLSNDWGGGGVVATAPDLNRFLVGLLAGRLFAHPGTLEEMLALREPPGASPRFAGIGLGMLGFELPGGDVLVGHSGAWGARMVVHRSSGLFLSGTVNRRVPPPDWIADIAAEILAS